MSVPSGSCQYILFDTFLPQYLFTTLDTHLEIWSYIVSLCTIIIIPKSHIRLFLTCTHTHATNLTVVIILVVSIICSLSLLSFRYNHLRNPSKRYIPSPRLKWKRRMPSYFHHSGSRKPQNRANTKKYANTCRAPLCVRGCLRIVVFAKSCACFFFFYCRIQKLQNFAQRKRCRATKFPAVCGAIANFASLQLSGSFFSFCFAIVAKRLNRG